MAKAVADYLAELRDWDADGFDEHWELVERLVADVGPEPAAAMAREWCDSPDPDCQGAGLDVLGRLARTDAGLVDELHERVRAVRGSDDEDVRWSAAVALQRIDDAGAQDLLCLFLTDPDPDVRCQAVYGLSVPTDPNLAEDHPVVQALLRAMQDPDDDVRDWATFIVGSQLDADTPAVRDGLADRLDDDGGDTAGEAAVGLARRHDPRVYRVLTAVLADPDIGNLYVEAAAELADPRLLPLLRELKAGGWQDHEALPSILDDAIAACSKAPPG